MSDADVCSALVDARKSDDLHFLEDVADEAARRELRPGSCAQILAERQRSRLAVGAMVAAAAAVVAVARTSPAPASPQPLAQPLPTFGHGDTNWAWDEFYDENWNLTWACRGMQTAQFVDKIKCYGKPLVDSTWPSKSRTGR